MVDTPLLAGKKKEHCREIGLTSERRVDLSELRRGEGNAESIHRTGDAAGCDAHGTSRSLTGYAALQKTYLTMWAGSAIGIDETA